MSGGVLTTSDFIKQKGIEDGSDKAPVPDKKAVKIEYLFFLEHAPMGKCHTVIKFNDKPIKIELVDKVYSPPKQWGVNKTEKFKRVLTEVYDFKDISVATALDEPKSKAKKKYKYTIGHPDNSAEEKVNGNVAVEVKGKSMSFECKDGQVTVEDKDVFEAFLEKKWYEISVEEID